MMRVNCFALLLACLTTYTIVDAIDKGDIILQHNFDGPAEEAIWNKFLGPLIQLETTDRGNKALRIDRKLSTSSIHICSSYITSIYITWL